MEEKRREGGGSTVETRDGREEEEKANTAETRDGREEEEGKEIQQRRGMEERRKRVRKYNRDEGWKRRGEKGEGVQ